MRILHTIDSAGIYGAETVLLNLASEQQRRGDTPIIFSIGNKRSFPKPIEIEARKQNLQCIAHRMADGLNFSGAKNILQIARQERIDVIHSHGYKSNILLGITPRSRRPCPIITTLHGWTAAKALSKLGLYRFIDQRLLPRLDAVVVVNESLIGTPALGTLDARRAYVIPNGIILDEPSELGSNDDSLKHEIQILKGKVGILIGAVGRLSREKNFLALIGALNDPIVKSQRIGVVILGDGPEADSIKGSIAAHGLSETVLLGGYIQNARRYLDLFDALIIPSLTEGLPMILLEAMSKNLPIIATKVGQIPTVLGDLGILVAPGSASELASSIVDMSINYAHYKLAGSTGRERVKNNYSASTMAEAYKDVYRIVVEQHQSTV